MVVFFRTASVSLAHGDMSARDARGPEEHEGEQRLEKRPRRIHMAGMSTLQQFGAEYEAYRAGTWRLVPGLY